METLSLLEIVFLSLTISLFILKTAHFITRIRHRKLLYWFYFGSESIINSRNEQSAKAKKLQNTYSVLFFILLVVTSCIVLLKKNWFAL